MSKDKVAESEPVLEVGKFDNDDNAPENSAYIRWDVKGGGDRDHYPGFDTWQPLEGSPNIQGYTCRSAIDIWIYLGDENTRFAGPTEGKVKIDPRRVSKYKIVRR